MKVAKFEIEESKVNKNCLLLIAITEDGKKFVVSGDHYMPTYVIPYESAFDTNTDK